MSELFRVPKHQVAAEVVLPGRPALALNLYLSDCAESHAGAERPSDLLNGPLAFLPATDAQGGMVLLQREAVMIVTVAAASETGGDPAAAQALASDEATRIRLEVLLEDGSSLRGQVRFLMPEGRRRLQDFLNLPDRFLVLEEGDRVHLIQKRRIVRLTPL